MVQIHSLQKLCLLTFFDQFSVETCTTIERTYVSHILKTCENFVVLEKLRKYISQYHTSLIGDKLFDALHHECTKEIYADFSGNCLTVKAFSAVLKRCIHVQTLEVNFKGDETVPCVDILWVNPLPHLSSLCLGSCDTLTDKHVHLIIQHTPSLSTLKLGFCHKLTNKVFLVEPDVQLTRERTRQTDLYSPEKFKCRLSTVEISGGPLLSSQAFLHLASLCGPHLRAISLPGCQVDCTVLLYLAGYTIVGVLSILSNSSKEEWLQNVEAETNEQTVMSENQELKSVRKIVAQLKKEELLENKHVPHTIVNEIDPDDKEHWSTQPAIQIFHPRIISLNAERLVFQKNSQVLGALCLAKFLEQNPTLRKFGISWGELSPRIFKLLLPKLAQLEEVSLENCQMLGSAGVAALGSTCRHLTHVNLREAVFYDDDSLIPVLSLDNLTHLNILAGKITDKTLENIAEMVSDKLEVLSLSMCEDIQVKGMTKLCCHIPNIRVLHVAKCPVPLQLLAENCLLLEELDISCMEMENNDLFNIGITSIANHLNNLRILVLSWNIYITDEPIKLLLRECLHLEKLYLDGLQVTTDVFIPMIIPAVSTTEQCHHANLRSASEVKPQGDSDGGKGHSGKGQQEAAEAQSLQAQLGADHVQMLADTKQLLDAFTVKHHNPAQRFLRSRTYGSSLRFLSLTYCAQIDDNTMSKIVRVCGKCLEVKDFFGASFSPW